MKFRIVVYRIILLVLFPVALVWGLVQKKHRVTFLRRSGLGRCGTADPGGVVLHAVSVGEVLAVKKLIRELRNRFEEIPLTVTTVTATGQSLLQGEKNAAYFPLDLAFSIRRFLRRLDPQLVILAETEIWPNFIFHLARRNIPLLLINARLSDRSFSRYRRFRWFWKPFVEYFSGILAQSEVDGERFSALGALHVEVSGNVKFDFQPPKIPENVRDLFREITTGRSCWAAGSTMPGEDEPVLVVHKTLKEELDAPLLLLAPRHPERVEEIGKLCDTNRLNYALRSTMSADENVDVILLDTIGELAALYAFFPLVFVGGSLVPSGGHNVVEPAFWGCTTIVGPHMDNFRAMTEAFLKKDALIQVERERFADAVKAEIVSPGDRGERAREVVRENQGALKMTLDRIGTYLS